MITVYFALFGCAPPAGLVESLKAQNTAERAVRFDALRQSCNQCQDVYWNRNSAEGGYGRSLELLKPSQ